MGALYPAATMSPLFKVAQPQLIDCAHGCLGRSPDVEIDWNLYVLRCDISEPATSMLVTYGAIDCRVREPKALQ